MNLQGSAAINPGEGPRMRCDGMKSAPMAEVSDSIIIGSGRAGLSVSAQPLEITGRPLMRLWPLAPAISMALICLAAACGPASADTLPPTAVSAPDVLVVAGGPDPDHNQVAIESNARYVLDLYRSAASRFTLFADGKPHSATVLYESAPPTRSTAQTAAELITTDSWRLDEPLKYRATRLRPLNGPASHAAVDAAFERLARSGGDHPITLYFTGHGTQDQDAGGSCYCLWNDELSVKDLSRDIARLPAASTVTLIMAQCFSGGFAADLFRNGNPGSGLIPQDLAGFFGTTQDRMAAGCTPDINEADYQDFTSYFIAALSGRDRLGRVVTGADYNNDGRVGMDEAFCYALIHDPSIDVPVCTSDLLVRSRAGVDDFAVFRTPYSAVRSWASPAQAAALDSLAAAEASETLNSNSEPANVDMLAVYHQVASHRASDDAASQRQFRVAAMRFLNTRGSLRSWAWRRWPALKRPGSAGFEKARQALIAHFTEGGSGAAESLVTAQAALDHLAGQWEGQEVEQARKLRLLRLYKTIVLTHQILTGPSARDRNDLLRVLHAEQRSLFPIKTASADLTALKPHSLMDEE